MNESFNIIHFGILNLLFEMLEHTKIVNITYVNHAII